jgi:hypothetical protein
MIVMVFIATFNTEVPLSCCASFTLALILNVAVELSLVLTAGLAHGSQRRFEGDFFDLCRHLLYLSLPLVCIVLFSFVLGAVGDQVHHLFLFLLLHFRYPRLEDL